VRNAWNQTAENAQSAFTTWGQLFPETVQVDSDNTNMPF